MDKFKLGQGAPVEVVDAASLKKATHPRADNIVEYTHQKVLSGESYENASHSLDEVESLQNFRKQLAGQPFGNFYDTFESLTNINKALLPEDEKKELIERFLAHQEERAPGYSPRVADLYLAILSQLRAVPYEPKFEMTKEKIIELMRSNDLAVLTDDGHSWGMKLNRIQQRLAGYLAGARAIDKREGREMDDDARQIQQLERQEKLKTAPSRPPERRNRSKPGVDAMERLKEGERAPAIWTIEPGFDGTKYFKERSLSGWDNATNEWVEEGYQYSDVELLPLLENEDRKKGLVNIRMKARCNAGVWISCAIPYTHGLHKIDAGGRRYTVKEDQNGDVVILIEGQGEVDVEVLLASKGDKRLISEKPKKPSTPIIPSEFSEETNQKLVEVNGKKRGNIAKARALASYVRGRIRYLTPNNQAEAEDYNRRYRTHAKGFAGAVDEIRQGDCDVVNTYFAALCARLNIPVRYAEGHSVKGRDNDGASHINMGTGHGWLEAWDETREEWVLLDATPSGDPNLEDDSEQKGLPPSGQIAGDDIEQEAVRPTDEQLEKLRQKLAERKEELSYTKEERELAQAGGVTPKEARKIVKEILEAENTRLPSGELLVDLLAQVFTALVESRKTPAISSIGPVRQREGGEEIKDMVSHYIKAQSGDMDPDTRDLPDTEVEEELLVTGFDVIIIGDKSGSTENMVDGEKIWQMQRRAEYLLFSALDRLQKNLERAGLQKKNALSVRTQAISFRGPDDIDEDKPKSQHFWAKDKVQMWNSLTTIGSNNGDAAALRVVLEQIKAEIAERQKNGLPPENRLRIVIPCSDGGYVGDEAVQMQQLAKELYELGVLVVGLGLTETAEAVLVVMEKPPYSRGDLARDVNDLPVIAVKHIIEVVIRLFPAEAREYAQKIINAILAKFPSKT